MAHLDMEALVQTIEKAARGRGRNLGPSILVSVTIFSLIAIPALLISAYGDAVIGNDAPPQLKSLFTLSGRLILLLDVILSIAYLMSKLSGQRTVVQD